MTQKVVVRKGMAGVPEFDEQGIDILEKIADFEGQMTPEEFQLNLQSVALAVASLARITSMISLGGKTVVVTQD